MNRQPPPPFHDPRENKDSFNFEGQRDPKRGHFYTKRYNEMNQEPSPRNHNRNMTIALSVVSCLFMGVVGYELLAHSQNNMAQQTASPPVAAPALYTSANNTQQPGSLFLADNASQSYNSGDSLLELKRLTKEQAAEIHNLRQQIAEKSDNIQEIKAHLFRQEGDPKDKAKIAELAQSLNDREREYSALSLKVQTAERESTELQKKIMQLEVMRDALVATIENLRANKEKEHIALKDKISSLENVAAVDKKALQQKVQQLEAAQNHLTDALEQKKQVLENTQSSLSAHMSELDNKSDALNNMVSQYRTLEESIKKDIVDLVNDLQYEATAKIISESQASSALGHHFTALEQMHSALNSHQQQLAQLQEHHASLKHQWENDSAITKEQTLNMIAAIELEALAKGQLLEQYEALAAENPQQYAELTRQQQELKDTSQQNEALQLSLDRHMRELDIRQFMIADLDLKLKVLADGYQESQEVAMAQINNLITNIESKTYLIDSLHDEIAYLTSMVQQQEILASKLGDLTDSYMLAQNQVLQRDTQMAALEEAIQIQNEQLDAFVRLHSEQDEHLLMLSWQLVDSLALNAEQHKHLQESNMNIALMLGQLNTKEDKLNQLSGLLRETNAQLHAAQAESELLDVQQRLGASRHRQQAEQHEQHKHSYYSLLDHLASAEQAMLSALALIDQQQDQLEHRELMLQSNDLKTSILKEELNLYRTKLNQQTQQSQQDLLSLQNTQDELPYYEELVIYEDAGDGDDDKSNNVDDQDDTNDGSSDE